VNPQPELVVNPDVRQVNLEHILPKSPKEGQWKSFTEEDQKLYVHRLGNMALLQKGANGRIGNQPWTVKKPILAGSALVLTRERRLLPPIGMQQPSTSVRPSLRHFQSRPGLGRRDDGSIHVSSALCWSYPSETPIVIA
jgi:hypothetical protein